MKTKEIVYRGFFTRKLFGGVILGDHPDKMTRKTQIVLHRVEEIEKYFSEGDAVEIIYRVREEQ